ncbi:hypothetical protein LTS18_002533, partial [Coniosporium uncinatum]
MVECPLCNREVEERYINSHIDSNCADFLEPDTAAPPKSNNVASFFQTPAVKRATSVTAKDAPSTPTALAPPATIRSPGEPPVNGLKRPLGEADKDGGPSLDSSFASPRVKKQKPNHLAKAAPLADRMRPRTLDDVY